MLDFVVLNIGYHRSLHPEGDHTASTGRPGQLLMSSGLLVGRLAARARSHRGEAQFGIFICAALAVQPPCRPHPKKQPAFYRTGSALFTTASSPGPPEKENPILKLPIDANFPSNVIRLSNTWGINCQF